MTTQMSKVIQHLRSTLLLRDGTDLTDGELLECFVSRRESAALEALVQRHGSMVWGVCLRILHNHHDAEDAFQATFLVLVRKAASVTPREMVGNWLYGVAQQTALKLRATTAKQRTRERQVDMLDPAVKEQNLSGDWQLILDQELSHLPDTYRVAIVLCDLEGETRKEAARQLGLPEGTLAGRLTRGRAMLAKRLARHGLAVTGGTLAAWLSQTVASASVPTSVLSSTMKVVTLVAAGKTLATGLVSAKVAALTEGVLKAMLISKLKSVVAVVLVLGFIVAGATGLACRTSAAQDEKPPVAEQQVKRPQKQEPEREKEAFTAWGKEIGGLQAGLGFRPGEKRAYSHGEEAWIVLRLRNVGKEAVEFKHIGAYFVENPPTITDADGKVAKLPKVGAEGAHRVHSITVLPGKEVVLYQWNCGLLPIGGTSKNLYTIHGTGKFSFQCERIVGPTLSNPNHPDPKLDKLATGKLELEVKEAKKSDQEKEGFTAWGMEVGGLQAGLGFRPGEHRAYHPGETVKLVVRVRNVGKEEVSFQYLRHFLIENPPTVVNDKGKAIPFADAVNKDGLRKGIYKPIDVDISAGQEIDLYELDIELSGKVTDTPADSTIYGQGKFSVQYQKVLGDFTYLSSVRIKLDPVLKKLATGKLELEVKEAKKGEEKKEKGGFTAWGKEAGGLQAGLGFLPGEKRVYRHGEVINLIVRVRNVSKETVKFEYVRQFLDENLPTVTNADGKKVEQRRLSMLGFHVPMEVTLEPGKEIELESRLPLRYEFRPANDGEKPTTKERPLFVGTGKVSIHYEQVLGSSSSGAIKLDPALSKLGTGKLELEVREPEKPPQNELPKAKVEKKKVYTPDEVMLEQEKARGKAIDGSKSNIVTVEFKVQAVTKPTEIKMTTEKDSPYVVGHGPDDMCLHPQPPRKFEEKQFTAILTSKVVKQLQMIGIQDVGKHFMGKTIRVTGRINQHNYSGDEPPIETHYDLVLDDVSQFETVD